MTTTLTTCQRCGGENPSDAQYCIECGESLTLAIGPTTKLAAPVCPSCGAENPVDGRFCAICGRSLPEISPLGQGWATPQSIPQARLNPHAAPRAAAPKQAPVAPPIVVTPPAPPRAAQSYPRPMTTPRHYHPVRRHGPGFSPAGIVLILGMVGLFVLKLMSWPYFLLVGGAAFIAYQAEHGRLNQALRTVMMIAAGLFVVSNPRMWPLLFVVFMAMKLLGGNRRIW